MIMRLKSPKQRMVVFGFYRLESFEAEQYPAEDRIGGLFQIVGDQWICTGRNRASFGRSRNQSQRTQLDLEQHLLKNQKKLRRKGRRRSFTSNR